MIACLITGIVIGSIVTQIWWHVGFFNQDAGDER